MSAKTWIVRSLLGAGMACAFSLCLSAPPASASCSVNPQCTPNDELTGCCNADCTYKATSASCRLVDDSCHLGTCSAAHDCGNPTGQNAPGGSTCFPEPPFNVCSRGECHGGACGGIGSAQSTEYGARCPDTDGNQCTDHCLVNSMTGVFVACGTESLPDGVSCYTASGNDCQKGQCAAGACANLSVVVHCGSAPPTCQRRTCNPGTLTCSSVPDSSATCDDNANDCKDKFCTDAGQCKSVLKDTGTKCVPGSSDQDNNACTEEQCASNGRCELHIPLADGSRPPGCDAAASQPCRFAECVDQSGTVTCQQLVDTGQINQTCTSDTNPCSNQKCDTFGNCNYDTCNSGGCVLCGQNGHCAGTTQATCACTFP